MIDSHPVEYPARLRARCLVTAVVALCCLIPWEPAAAETPGDDETGLAAVVVTAQRIKEDVQTTPIAISVYSADALRTAGINNLASLTTMAPDVSFTTTEGQSIITIRGISSRDT